MDVYQRRDVRAEFTAPSGGTSRPWDFAVVRDPVTGALLRAPGDPEPVAGRDGGEFEDGVG
ncbi:hypothetical protein GCM10010483_26100 [Actinokineospora diospyrosa]